jgi:hypothetical protein
MSKARMDAGLAGQLDVDHFLPISVFPFSFLFFADDMSASNLASLCAKLLR